MTDTSNPEREERDDRVAEYALGTLPEADRAAFEAELARDPELQRAVAAWSVRLQPLADSVPVVTPPPDLRARVLSRIAPQGSDAAGKSFSVARWLAWTFGLSAVAGAVAAALTIFLTPQPPALGGYAMLHDPGGSDSVVVFQVDRERRDIVVLASAPEPAAGHDYELWVMPPGKNPISLGLVKAGVRQERPLPPAAAPFVKQGANLGISLEPAGGAPGGLPTGPVLFTGMYHLAGS